MIIYDRFDMIYFRYFREVGFNLFRLIFWKSEGGMSIDKREIRYVCSFLCLVFRK